MHSSTKRKTYIQIQIVNVTYTFFSRKSEAFAFR